MANINKIKLSGTTYSIQDLNATKTVELTQAQYDALTVKDPNTFYVITDAEGGDLSNYYTKSEADTLLASKANTSAVTQVNNALTAHTADTSVHVTASEKETWNNKSDFSGSYNDLTDKPTIPVVPTNVSAFNNDSGYITSSAISGKADTSAVTQAISAAVSGKADTSTVTSLSNVVTAHTADTTIHTTSAEKTSWNAKLDASDVENFFGAVNYDSNTKRINFYNTSTGGTVLAYVDATDFIKDGMVSNVEIKTITSGGSQVEVIAITFNADAGKEEIDIPLTDVFDPNNYYTKTEVDNLIPTVPTSNTAFTNDAQYATSGYVDSAVSGKADTSAFTAHTADTTIHTTSNEKASWNGAVTKSNTNETALGGLKFVSLTQAQYDALTTKDSSTVYFING